MKVLIIEDEIPAAKRLTRLLMDYDADIEVLDQLDSVKKSVHWLQSHEPPELIFMDIQLADGLSFEIFDYVSIEVPVIFTTAYDEYALQAFKVNSIDYLLKPLDQEAVAKAFDKLNKLRGTNEKVVPTIKQIASAMSMVSNQYKNRFLIKTGEHIKSVAVDDIDYFFSRDKATYCHTHVAKNYLLDYSLDQLDTMLNPQDFFRINRKYIIALRSVKDIISYTNSRLKIVFHHEQDKEEVIVSRDRVGEFKQWLDV